jgi:hypothetical protein
MTKRGILSFLSGLLVISTGIRDLRADSSTELPEFKEVFELIRAHMEGASDKQLDRAAVQALVSALGPRVMLVGTANETNTQSTGPLLSQVNIYDGEFACLRIGRVADGLPEAVRKTFQELIATNKLNGLILDLRYASGGDYAATAGVADLFVASERPLLNWGSGMVKSKEKTDALTLPVAVLVNHQTAMAAEALAALVRETGAGVVLGSRTAGQAMMSQEFPLKNGERLRIATTPVQVGDGTLLTAEGVKPDIAVRVNSDDERAYFADAYRGSQYTNPALASASPSTLNAGGGTNRTRRARFGEAELIRERQAGTSADSDSPKPREAVPEKPVVRDPVLARALDILKGLAVVRQSRS